MLLVTSESEELESVDRSVADAANAWALDAPVGGGHPRGARAGAGAVDVPRGGVRCRGAPVAARCAAPGHLGGRHDGRRGGAGRAGQGSGRAGPANLRRTRRDRVVVQLPVRSRPQLHAGGRGPAAGRAAAVETTWPCCWPGPAPWPSSGSPASTGSGLACTSSATSLPAGTWRWPCLRGRPRPSAQGRELARPNGERAPGGGRARSGRSCLKGCCDHGRGRSGQSRQASALSPAGMTTACPLPSAAVPAPCLRVFARCWDLWSGSACSSRRCSTTTGR